METDLRGDARCGWDRSGDAHSTSWLGHDEVGGLLGYEVTSWVGGTRSVALVEQVIGQTTLDGIYIHTSLDTDHKSLTRLGLVRSE
jgi:hypothetical protein